MWVIQNLHRKQSCHYWNFWMGQLARWLKIYCWDCCRASHYSTQELSCPPAWLTNVATSCFQQVQQALSNWQSLDLKCFDWLQGAAKVWPLRKSLCQTFFCLECQVGWGSCQAKWLKCLASNWLSCSIYNYFL